MPAQPEEEPCASEEAVCEPCVGPCKRDKSRSPRRVGPVLAAPLPLACRTCDVCHITAGELNCGFCNNWMCDGCSRPTTEDLFGEVLTFDVCNNCWDNIDKMSDNSDKRSHGTGESDAETVQSEKA